MTKNKLEELKEIITPENEGEDEGTSIIQVIVLVAFSVGSFYAYFAGYNLRFKNLDLWEYSFLVIGCLFAIAFAYTLYSYFQEQKTEK